MFGMGTRTITSAPLSPNYVVKTAQAGLPNEVVLDDLTAGFVKVAADGGLTSTAAIPQADVTNLTTDLAAKQPLDADLTAIAGLADPNADRILFWDDSAGSYAYLTPGTNLTVTGTTIDAAGGGDFVRIDEKTGAAASYSFTSIPGTYRHLLIDFVVRTDAANPAYDLRVRYNNDTGANYNVRKVTDVTAATESGATSGFVTVCAGAGATDATGVSTGTLRIQEYADTTHHKGAHAQGGCPDGGGAGPYITNAFVHWENNSAITQIDLYPSSGSFTSICSATLYGLK